jgi:dTDP-4-amino-4,6-dideoxygalactose transaminase
MHVAHSVYRTLYLPPEDVEVRVPYSFMGSIYDEQELEAVRRVMERGWLTTGLETVAFEEQFASYHGVPHAYAVANCTTALHMAAQLCRFDKGDEVITTPSTFISTNQAIVATGAIPVFVDIDPRTWNIDPERVRAAVTPRTRAIFLTHLTGQMCDMDAIMAIADEHDLLVVEDAAHAAGATYKGRFAGSIGDIGCFSFHAIKNMSTLGEGGMVTTRRDEFALKIPWLRSMGSRYPGDSFDDGTPGPRPYEIDDVDGTIPSNVRMTEAQAAVGQVQLRKLRSLLDRRREIARAWSAQIAELPGLTPPYEDPDCTHAWHIYAFVVDAEEAGFTNKELVDKLLYDHGVQCMPGLYRPSYLFELYRKRGIEPGLCPVAESVAENTLQLPLNPALTDDDVAYVNESLVAAVDALRGSVTVSS